MCRWFDSSSGHKNKPESLQLSGFFLWPERKTIYCLSSGIEVKGDVFRIEKPHEPAFRDETRSARLKGFQFWPQKQTRKPPAFGFVLWSERKTIYCLSSGIEVKGDVFRIEKPHEPAFRMLVVGITQLKNTGLTAEQWRSLRAKYAV